VPFDVAATREDEQCSNTNSISNHRLSHSRTELLTVTSPVRLSGDKVVHAERADRVHSAAAALRDDDEVEDRVQYSVTELSGRDCDVPAADLLGG
jgi:hypothetical protein